MKENWKHIEHFKKSEFTCECGCNQNNISYRLVQRLDMARRYAKVPFIINSAFRCIKHNKSVGGSDTSTHKKGLAVDIRVKTSFQRCQILKSLIDENFNRIGVYENFIHVDIDENKAQNVIWYK